MKHVEKTVMTAEKTDHYENLEPLECIGVHREYFINVPSEHQLTIVLNRVPTDTELKGLKSMILGNLVQKRISR